MSWSVSACGPAAKVAEQLEQQFATIKLVESGEMETVHNTRQLVLQTLLTIDPSKPVQVSASGSMGFADWQTKAGAYQSVVLTINPIHFTAS